MKLAEEEKKYESLYLYTDSSKIDLKNYKEKNKFKYPRPILNIILFAAALLVMILGGILYIYLIFILGVIMFMFSLWHISSKYLTYRKTEFLKQYELNIIKESKKYDNVNVVSALYPIYLITDNQNQILTITYQNKEYIKFDYNDILEYKIFIDRHEIGKRLPETPDKTIRSYVMVIALLNNKKVEIGFSNANPDFKLKGKYIFAQYANTISINKIATILDKIIKKTNKNK